MYNIAKEKIKQSKLGMLVFSPDAIKSDLTGSIISKIKGDTGLNNTGQQWFQHEGNSIIKFYQNSIPDNAPHLHLIQKLFTYSKVLVTFWEGEDVFNKLQKIKGASHPADAKAGTIRSGFYCDNSITNLIHASDDADEMLREMDIMKISDIPDTIYQGPETNVRGFKHNGGYQLLTALQQYVRPLDEIKRSIFYIPHDDIPADMDARKTFNLVSRALKKIEAETSDDTIKVVIRCFFEGKADELDNIMLNNPGMPVEPWSRIVIQSSSVCVGKWGRLRIDDVIYKLKAMLGDSEYLISGSSALYLNDMSVKPNDIDIWCDESNLIKISKKLNIEIIKDENKIYTANKVLLNMDGWEIEIVGDVYLKSGRQLFIDEQIIKRSKENIESVEDVLCEMLAFNRKNPKNDLGRVLKAISMTKVDFRYMANRLVLWKINPAILDLIGE